MQNTPTYRAPISDAAPTAFGERPQCGRARHSADCAWAQDHLFAGSDGGGHRCKDVLERMVEAQTMNELDALLPWNWRSTSVNH
jgi:hypothetical protein